MCDLRKVCVGLLIVLLLSLLLQNQFSSPTTENSYEINEGHTISSSTDTAAAASTTSIALRSVRNILRACYNETITQLEVTNYIDAIMRTEGSDGVLSFPTIIMTKDEAQKPYGHSNDDTTHIILPTSEPVVTIRAGARVNGRCCDVFRTFLFESATQEMIDAYSTVLNTQLSVIAAVAPGITVAELDSIVQSGLSAYIGQPNMTYSYTWGHGTGSFAAEGPFFSNETTPTSLIPDQVFTVQIWLYLEGTWYIRIEDTVMVTDTGVEVLSDAPKSIEEIMIRSESAFVDSELSIDFYEFGEKTTINTTISDSTNRLAVLVDFFNGRVWTPMQNLANNTYGCSYIIDTTIPSLIDGLVRINFTNNTIYTLHRLEYSLDYSILRVLDPPIQIVLEQDTTDTPMRWIFSHIGAEMVRIHFLKVYPPPGDQFLVRNSTGHVIFEYKWNFGDPAVSPWVPGNTLFVDVIPTYQSVYGGVNHFYFTVDLMWMFDIDASPTTPTTTTTPTSPTVTTTPTTTSFTSNSSMNMDYVWILIGGLFCIAGSLFAVFKIRGRNL